jgi:hypothetical protein
VGLPAVVIFGFVRVGTSARAFDHPMTPAGAGRHVRSWLGQPVVQVLDTDAPRVERVLASLEELGVAGNLVTDAQIAAAAVEHGAVVHTADTDFMRFPDVRRLNPLTGAKGRGPGSGPRTRPPA